MGGWIEVVAFSHVFIYLFIFARPLEDLSIHSPLCVVKRLKRVGLLCKNYR